jgi:hypothetical protein
MLKKLIRISSFSVVMTTILLLAGSLLFDVLYTPEREAIAANLTSDSSFLTEINPGFPAPGRNTNCHNCAITLAEMVNNLDNHSCLGPACALPSPMGSSKNIGEYFGTQRIKAEDFADLLYIADEFHTRSGIRQGIVTIHSKDGIGHAFNLVINQDGTVKSVRILDAQKGAELCVEDLLSISPKSKVRWHYFPVRKNNYPRTAAPVQSSVGPRPDLAGGKLGAGAGIGARRGTFQPSVPVQLRPGAGGPGNIFAGIGASGGAGVADTVGKMNLGVPVPPYNNRPRPSRMGGTAGGDCLNTVCPY